MSIDDDLAPRDFADKGIREQLENPDNLRDVLHEVLGEHAAGFVCEDRELLKPRVHVRRLAKSRVRLVVPHSLPYCRRNGAGSRLRAHRASEPARSTNAVANAAVYCPVLGA